MPREISGYVRVWRLHRRAELNGELILANPMGRAPPPPVPNRLHMHGNKNKRKCARIAVASYFECAIDLMALEKYAVNDKGVRNR